MIYGEGSPPWLCTFSMAPFRPGLASRHQKPESRGAIGFVACIIRMVEQTVWWWWFYSGLGRWTFWLQSVERSFDWFEKTFGGTSRNVFQETFREMTAGEVSPTIFSTLLYSSVGKPSLEIFARFLLDHFWPTAWFERCLGWDKRQITREGAGRTQTTSSSASTGSSCFCSCSCWCWRPCSSSCSCWCWCFCSCQWTTLSHFPPTSTVFPNAVLLNIFSTA